MKGEVPLTPARSLCRRASPFAWELAYDQNISAAAGLLVRGGHDAVAAVLLAREDDARIQVLWANVVVLGEDLAFVVFQAQVGVELGTGHVDPVSFAGCHFQGMGLLTLFIVQLALMIGLTESGAGLLGERPDLSPELLPGGAFLDGQLAKFFVVAHNAQVGILLPVLQVIDNADRKKGILLEEAGAHGQVGLEPFQGVLTQASLFL